MSALVWHGHPGLLAHQRRKEAAIVHRDKHPGHPRVGLPSAGLVDAEPYAEALVDMGQGFARQWVGEPLSGPLTAMVDTWWPAVHRNGGAEGQPLGSAESGLRAVGDALVTAGVILHAHQIRTWIASSHTHTWPGRIEVRLAEWSALR